MEIPSTLRGVGGVDCPFDWSDPSTPSSELQGGQVLYHGPLTYCYGYFNRQDQLTNVLILPKLHTTQHEFMAGPAWSEAAQLYLQGCRENAFGGSMNPSLNDGIGAGQRWEHGHLHGVRRREGEPSYGMGLHLLRNRFDQLIVELGYTLQTAERVGDTQRATQLKHLINMATKQ